MCLLCLSLSLAKSLQEFAAVLQNLEDERTRMVSDLTDCKEYYRGLMGGNRKGCAHTACHYSATIMTVIGLTPASQIDSEDRSFIFRIL